MPLAAHRADRIARKTEHVLRLAIVLELIAIARRLPPFVWFLLFVLLAFAALLVEWLWVDEVAYVLAALALVVAAKLVPGFVRGWRSPSRAQAR